MEKVNAPMKEGIKDIDITKKREKNDALRMKMNIKWKCKKNNETQKEKTRKLKQNHLNQQEIWMKRNQIKRNKKKKKMAEKYKERDRNKKKDIST